MNETEQNYRLVYAPTTAKEERNMRLLPGVNCRPVNLGDWRGYWRVWLLLSIGQWGIAVIKNIPAEKEKV